MPMTPPRLAMALIMSSESWRSVGTIARQLEWEAMTGPAVRSRSCQKDSSARWEASWMMCLASRALTRARPSGVRGPGSPVPPAMRVDFQARPTMRRPASYHSATSSVERKGAAPSMRMMALTGVWLLPEDEDPPAEAGLAGSCAGDVTRRMDPAFAWDWYHCNWARACWRAWSAVV